MEDTLRVAHDTNKCIQLCKVLILVLMEDTLRELLWQVLQKLESVLILVLMEDTLRVKKLTIYQISQSLNPCFNGRYSQSFN